MEDSRLSEGVTYLVKEASRMSGTSTLIEMKILKVTELSYKVRIMPQNGGAECGHFWMTKADFDRTYQVIEVL